MRPPICTSLLRKPQCWQSKLMSTTSRKKGILVISSVVTPFFMHDTHRLSSRIGSLSGESTSTGGAPTALGT